MRHRNRGNRLNRTASHKKAMLSNTATSLVNKESIRTTDAKAKELRRVVERLITLAKRGDLHARRQVLKVIKDKSLVAKLFDDIATRFDDRNGGYLRIVKLGQRKGDGAKLSIIEFVESKAGDGEEAVQKTEAVEEVETVEQVKKETEKGDVEAVEGEEKESKVAAVQEETQEQETDEIEKVEDSKKKAPVEAEAKKKQDRASISSGRKSTGSRTSTTKGDADKTSDKD